MSAPTHRRAVITIDWFGPDKKVRGLIEDAIDQLFMKDEFMEAIHTAWSDVTFIPRVKENAS